jgi:cytochrome b561
VTAIKEVELRRGLTVLVCAAGVAGLILDSWPRPAHGTWINLHPLFGVLLMIAALVQFQQHAGNIRQLSRAVFLLLYLLFGVSQIIRIGARLWNSQAHGASHPAILQRPENLRDYLAYGVLALLAIHVLGALRGVNVRRQRAQQMNQATSSVAGGVALPWERARVQNPR